MKAKMIVAVIYGGPSREHEVSVKTGKAVLSAIDVSKYTPVPVEITRDNTWKIKGSSYSVDEAINYLKENTDFVFIALHGTFGEDGQLQRILEEKQIPFSGSKSKQSYLAMEKDQTSTLYKKAGMLVPNELIYGKDFPHDPDLLIRNLSLPLIVKPVAQGSSLGVSKILETKELIPAIERALEEGDHILIQEYINGVEVSAGVIEDKKGELIALPPTQLMPVKASFFDYDSKYTKGATKEITPPDLPQNIIENIQTLALAAHKIIGCAGYSRTDMIIHESEIYMIETNTLPGLTDVSILPQQAKVAGISFTKLIDVIIQSGMRNTEV